MVVGHKRIVNYFERVLKRGTLAHAYLFHGPEGVGKKTIALELAKSLLCPAALKEAFGGCGKCEECRRVDELTHPDLIFLSRGNPIVPEENKREIGIKNIHELRRRLAATSWRGGKKVAIVDGVERFSRDAASALLKTLEEPARESIFIMTTASLGSVLQTIRSRSVAVSFTEVSNEDMELLLSKSAAASAGLFLALANGRPGVLTRLLGDEDFSAASKKDFSKFEKLIAADIDDKFSFSESESREAGRLEALLLFLVAKARKKLIGSDQPEGKDKNGGAKSSSDLVGFLRSLLSSRFLLETTSVNRRLLADSILFDLHLAAKKGIL